MAHVLCASVFSSPMYEMLCTQLDIAHAVGVLSRYMLTPGKSIKYLSIECLGICVAQKIMLYATKGSLKLTMK
jgi:hypothetical protein